MAAAMEVIFAAPAARRDRQPGGRAVGGTRAALSDVADGSHLRARLRATLESPCSPLQTFDERSFRRRLGLPASRCPAGTGAAAAARRDHRRRPRRRRRHRGAALAPRRRHRLHQRRLGVPGRHRRCPRPRRPCAPASASTTPRPAPGSGSRSAASTSSSPRSASASRSRGCSSAAPSASATTRSTARPRTGWRRGAARCTGASTASPRCAPRKASASTPARWSISATG